MPKKRVSPAKKKQEIPTETSASIAEQTKAFLEKGGVIDQVAQGESGQESITGRRHIRLG